jgi:hypothetical protein
MPFSVTPRAYLLLVCGFVAAAVPFIGRDISTSYRAVSRALLGTLADFCAPSVPGAAPNLEECTNLLEYGTMYYEDLDAPDQRAALLRFYSSTGGAYWNAQLVSDAERQQFSQLVTELEESGYGLSDQTLNDSMLPTNLVSDMANLPALSVNCTLQQWLSFGQLLLKYQWGSDVSYCYWYGVVCCKTAVSHLSLCCIAAKAELVNNVWT